MLTRRLWVATGPAIAVRRGLCLQRPIVRSAAHHLQRRALQVQRNGAKNAGSGAEGAAVLSVGRRVTRCFSSRHTNATPEPTKAQLWLHVLNAAIPFVAFGFMDNLVMILAGDAIDGMLGVKFGLPTLYAAALGQVISDFTGVTFGGVVENMAKALGLPHSGMSRKQLALRHVKMIGLASAACGVVVGCLLGMTSLLFMDTEKTERMKFQAKLEPLFDTIVEEGRTIIGAEYSNLWLLDESNERLWSRSRKYQLPSVDALRVAFDHCDTLRTGTITASELSAAVAHLGLTGFDTQQSEDKILESNADYQEVKQLKRKYDTVVQDDNTPIRAELNFDQFCHLMHAILSIEQARVHIRPGGIKDEVIRTKTPLNVVEPNKHPKFNRKHNAITGYQTHSVLVCPILNKHTGECVGVMELANKSDDGGQGFSDEDERMVKLMCAHASIFIESVVEEQ